MGIRKENDLEGGEEGLSGVAARCVITHAVAA